MKNLGHSLCITRDPFILVLSGLAITLSTEWRDWGGTHSATETRTLSNMERNGAAGLMTKFDLLTG